MKHCNTVSWVTPAHTAWPSSARHKNASSVKKKNTLGRREQGGLRRSSPPCLCQTVRRVSGAGASVQEKTRITSRSHAAAAWHGVQLIPLQERSRAHRNDHHMMDLSAGAPHTNTTLHYTTLRYTHTDRISHQWGTATSLHTWLDAQSFVIQRDLLGSFLLLY